MRARGEIEMSSAETITAANIAKELGASPAKVRRNAPRSRNSAVLRAGR